MFPSSGLFARINCPFVKRGLCERPNCLYRHATNARDMFGTSSKSSIFGAAAHSAGYGSSMNDETRDDCVQELERINREIETIRHEVKQEQRRLSCYQTVQTNDKNTVPDFSVSKPETAGKHVDSSSYGLSPCTDSTKIYSQARKYVVDNSKPRTDLEYDPLSNFSANLCSYSSSCKEQKVKKDQGLKRLRNNVPCNQDMPHTHQAPLSRSPSPEPPDDSNEDDMLIIDIPLSPEKKRGRAEKLDCVDGKSQDAEEELKKANTVPVLLNSPPSCFVNAELSEDTSGSKVKANKVDDNCDAENSSAKYIVNICENKEFEITPGKSVVDLTGCLEDRRSESQGSTCFQVTEAEVENSAQPTGLSATADQQDLNWNNLVVEEERNTSQVEWSQWELPCSAEKMNPLQPCDFPLKNSLVRKAPFAHSDSPCRQQGEYAQTTEQPALNNDQNHQPPRKMLQSLVPESQKMLSKGQIQSKAVIHHTSSVSGSSQFQAQVLSSSVDLNLTNRAEADNEEVIIISSSSDEEEEFNYSEVELSDSDPEEECYRIFMEANNEEKRNEELPSTSVSAMDMEKSDPNITPQAFPGKKRVAHEAKHTESLGKSRPQPQVLVPFHGPVASGFGSKPSITPKMQQVQQTASRLTNSAKNGQAFVSSTCQKKPEMVTTPSAWTETQRTLQPAPVQSAYMNYIPFGTTVIDVGNTLHLILPEGTFPLPVSSSTSPVTSVLTPINQVKQTYHPPGLIPVQRCRTTAPVLIPPLARKPSLSPAFDLAQSNPAIFTTPQPAVHAAAAKPVSTRRKLKQQCEASKDKVPHDVRQHYVNLFTKEFIKTTATVNDAFQKALAEERTVYNRSGNKLRYQSVAVNALKRLRNQSVAAAKGVNEGNSQRSKDDAALYESLMDYILTEEKMIESNYPVQHPEKPGCAVLFADNKKGNTDPLKRICCRCGTTYSVSQTGKHVRKEECNYHYGKGVENKVPGGVETRYSCCDAVMGAPGCQVFKLHVDNSLSLDGFVSTGPRSFSDTGCPGIYSLDCETCYTIHGLELSRVTVVNSSLQVIYDTFVRPDSEVIDYNTRFSGINEEDVKGIHTSLREVQETLLSFIHADTILIGHGLEADLCALKLLHGTVVDISVVFPHRLGPPHRLTLKNLTAEYLRRIIQESVCGHDTAEDATACMELMLWKVKEDGKLKK
ncbi:RNA exonuclease 1 homolog isoform X3 [Mastacembelus armatus]|uniref:RNA exonuclease 1 homolog isoform X3 n=1 Tax=Mastacembelus armatus TaxID=205130 RepID=UPI001436A9CC|nr:RNA exonuclease 1 homolog isoform X3 [Mastacembelus armatus]